MDYEITHWKVPSDFGPLFRSLDVMVAIVAKRRDPTLYLYESDYNKIKRLAKQNLPEGTTLDNITFRGLVVENGGSKKGKRPGPKYNPERIKL